ncbi:MAG TPA: ATP-dependent DNA ligase [Gemmatimonadales bacterium]|nr:ATP-dependent DNA ligase [Gemmatimonadales bacterium]
MRLQDVVQTSRQVAETSGRIAKTGLLAALLKRTTPEEIEIAIGILSGAPRQGRLGIGYATLAAARTSRAAGGDAGSRGTLELAETDAALERLATTTGKGSAQAKERLLAELLGRAAPEEQEFLVRLLMGELRQGALEGLVTEAVARAAELDPNAVRRAAMLAGDLGAVARAALTEGAAGLARFRVQLLRPLQPMLAQAADDVADALRRVGEAAFEYKLDGARIQVHKAGDEVRVFSRQLNDVTEAVPEVVEPVRRLPVREAILDGEAIVLRSDGSPLPFQVTMRRFGRKLDVDRLRAELPLASFFFDVLYADGAALLDEPYAGRFEVLARVVPAAARVPRIVTAERGEAQTFFDRAIAAGHEGLMAKALGAGYEAGARGAAWLKVKPAHTLDLVVLAAEWGHGRRRGWLSNLHLGARDSEGGGGGFVMLGKTFKGMTDEMLAWQTRELLQRERTRDAHTVYVRPELVVEVAFNDIQESPQYPGGLALRFARVKRYRPDKGPADADTIGTVRELHQRAAQRR